MIVLAGFLASLFHPLAHAGHFEQFLLQETTSCAPMSAHADEMLTALETEGSATAHQDHKTPFVETHCEICHLMAHFMLPLDDQQGKRTLFSRVTPGLLARALLGVSTYGLERPPQLSS